MMISALESDECIAERFKKDYNEQFHILVRMHLSFMLDINTEENEAFSEKIKIKKWNLVPFSKKLRFRGIPEGVPLTQEGVCHVYQLIEYLKTDDRLKSEGIFRRTGSLERQQDLKSLLNKGQTLHLEDSIFSVHDCASVLKGFLAELPEPILTDAHFPVYCQIAESCGITKEPTQDVKLLEALQLLFLLLPNENKELLKAIIGLLHLTASYEEFNRMSPDNLAKLFTPHLLCPRKLSPEVLLKDSQTLFKIVSFMIIKFSELFKIPNKLVLDFRARYEKKKILSPSKRLNESISDAANTVFTFVDQERTAKENESNPTEKALAQLYAHIQTLPDSTKKRKLVKQFNKENGQGTPLQMRSGHGILKNKTLGDSIKKHLFHRGLARKKGILLRSSSNEEILETSSSSPSLITKKLFCHHNHNSSNETSQYETPAKRPKTLCTSPDCETAEKADIKRTKCDFDSSVTENNKACKLYLTSTPACLPLRACSDIDFTPEGQDRKSMSPITRSTQRMTRAMQETMMTPRSRKPVLVVSGTNINTLSTMEQPNFIMDSVVEELPSTSSEEDERLTKKTVFPKSKSETQIIESKNVQVDKLNKTESPSIALSDTFKNYLSHREMLTMSSPVDSNFSSRTDDFNSSEFETLNNVSKFSDSLLYCLDGNTPNDVSPADSENEGEEKELVLKPKQFDEDGKPIIFETSF